MSWRNWLFKTLDLIGIAITLPAIPFVLIAFQMFRFIKWLKHKTHTIESRGQYWRTP